MEVRRDIDDRVRFADEHDLTVGERAPCRVDVKSRDLSFGTSPETFPYDTALVDTVAGWEAKAHKPAAIIVVSQRTGDSLVVPTSTRASWSTRERFDRTRRIHESFFEVPRSSLRTLGELLTWLADRERRTTS